MSARNNDVTGLARAAGNTATPVVAPPASRWKTRILLPGLILAIVIVLVLATSAQTLLPATPVRVVPVVAKSVAGSAGTATVQAPGWLEPDPHPYYVAALADGVVKDVLVLEGDRVEPGQVVARLVDDGARLAAKRAEAEVLRQRSKLLAARADLAASELQLEHLVERSRAVSVGEAAVAQARAELVGGRADVAVERARLMEIEDEHARKSKLLETQAVPEATVVRLRFRVDAQQAVLEAVSAREAILAAKLDAAEADLHAAKTNLGLLIEERRAVALAEAAVGIEEATLLLEIAVHDDAALNLERMEVRSPVGGIVMRRFASPGSKLSHAGGEYSSHVVHLYDPAKLQVRVDVPLADAAHVSVGQRVEISVEVLPDRTFTGTVSRVVHQADIQKNTVEVKVAIDEPSAELKPEMLARARFLAREVTGGKSTRRRVFAPGSLVRDDGGGESVALVVGDLVDRSGRVERRIVVAGATRIDGWIEVESGLQLGDLLIAEPSSGLTPGDRVRVTGEAPRGEGG